MKKVNWVQKLTSRKFWAAVVGFVTPMILAFGGTESEATQIAGIIMAGGTLIAYIVGEGLVDKESAKYIEPLEDSYEEEEDLY